jgi:hypothetical protein
MKILSELPWVSIYMEQQIILKEHFQGAEKHC